MSTLTPFGIASRKLRLDKGLRLLDVATKLNKSSAFVSAIETGRKTIPDGFVRAVVRAMDLSAEEAKELRRSADRTRKDVTVEKLPEDQRELVAAFARKINELPTTMLDDLKKEILKSTDGEIPFRRKRRGIVVPALSTPLLREWADKVRSAFVADDQLQFPIMDVIECRLGKLFEGYCLDVQDRDTLGDEEGRVVAGKNCIILRTDVYEGAWKGNGRDRFTACHEFGHYLMHRSVTFARMRSDNDKIYCDAEWQADTFAGTLLMSPRHLHLFADPGDAAIKCKMTGQAAEVMWEKYQQEGRFKEPPRLPGLF